MGLNSEIHVSTQLSRTIVELGESAQRWLEHVPSLIARVAEEWHIEPVEQLLHEGSCSVVLLATTADGKPAVLKLSVPHGDARGEADALRCWNGRGAAGLLRSSTDGFTLLLERCIPGHDLWSLPIHEQIDVVAELLPRLWIPVDAGTGMRELRDTVAEWEVRMAPTRNDCAGLAEVLSRASGWARELRESPQRRLLHGDLNPGNVLATEGCSWVAIDPKPWVGDPAFDLAQLLLNWVDDDDPTGSESVETIARSAAMLAERLSLELERVLRWAVVKAVGWNAPRDHILALDAAARRSQTVGSSEAAECRSPGGAECRQSGGC